MMSKFLVAAMLSTALIGTASAQSTDTPSSTTAPSTMNRADTSTTSSASAQDMWRSTKLIGVNVYNENNEKLGAINDMIVDKQGKVEKVVIGVGGFLGMGEHSIAVSFDQLKWVNEPIKTSSAADTRPGGAGGMAAPPRPSTGTVGSTGTSTTGAPAKAWYPDHAVLSNATKDQLKAMPAFTYN